jgi:hypothetical protein
MANIEQKVLLLIKKRTISRIRREIKKVRLKEMGVEMSDDDNPWSRSEDEDELKYQTLSLVEGDCHVFAI